VSALSAGMVGVLISLDRVTIGRAATLLPVLGLAIAGDGFLQIRPKDPPPEPGRVRITIYTQPDCPYCSELRESVMPAIVREFGGRVATEYRPADVLPAVRRTPTIVLQPARAGSPPRVIEGLPALERLRGVIRDLEAAP
jgi:hypothetical protein